MNKQEAIERMKKYYVIFPNPNGEGNRIYGLVKTETMGLRMTRMGRKAYFFSHLTKLIEYNKEITFDVTGCDTIEGLICHAYKCIQEEAKKYPQFRWVALEDLE